MRSLSSSRAILPTRSSSTLVGMSYDAKGDVPNAQKYYRRALESNAHNLSNAFARPYARLQRALIVSPPACPITAA